MSGHFKLMGVGRRVFTQHPSFLKRMLSPLGGPLSPKEDSSIKLP